MFYTRRTFETLTALSVLVGILTGGMVYVIARAFVGDAAVMLALSAGFGSSLVYALLAGDALLRDMAQNAPPRGVKPPAEPRTYNTTILQTRLEVWYNQGYDALIMSLPTNAAKLYRWWHGMNETPGRSLAYALWCGRGKIFGEAEYRAVLSVLRQRGMIRWVSDEDHNKGQRWTPEGRVMLDTYVLTCPKNQNEDPIDTVYRRTDGRYDTASGGGEAA